MESLSIVCISRFYVSRTSAETCLVYAVPYVFQVRKTFSVPVLPETEETVTKIIFLLHTILVLTLLLSVFNSFIFPPHSVDAV